MSIEFWNAISSKINSEEDLETLKNPIIREQQQQQRVETIRLLIKPSFKGNKERLLDDEERTMQLYASLSRKQKKTFVEITKEKKENIGRN